MSGSTKTGGGVVWSAPGASSHGAYAPGKGQRLPAVDDRLVGAEAHAQIIDGNLIRTMGANHPHATSHFQVTHVFAGCLADGYEGAVDMLLRASDDTDAAPDVSIFPSGINPETGGRRLEEIVFEVLDTERLSHATEKAERFAKRGVRRVFCVRLSDRTVYEWQRALSGWAPVERGTLIEDVCFRVPIAPEALLDRVAADDTVARGLLAGRNAVIEAALSARASSAKQEGKAEGKAEMLLQVLSLRGLVPDASARQTVLACVDESQLNAWLARALTATSVAEVLTTATLPSR